MLFESPQGWLDDCKGTHCGCLFRFSLQRELQLPVPPWIGGCVLASLTKQLIEKIPQDVKKLRDFFRDMATLRTRRGDLVVRKSDTFNGARSGEVMGSTGSIDTL
jgi:hypothetical protein